MISPRQTDLFQPLFEERVGGDRRIFSARSFAARDAFEHRVRMRVHEEGHGIARCRARARRVDHAMRRRRDHVIGRAGEHVAGVDDEVVRLGFDGEPFSVAIEEFEPAAIRRDEDGDEIDVFMRGGAQRPGGGSRPIGG